MWQGKNYIQGETPREKIQDFRIFVKALPLSESFFEGLKAKYPGINWDDETSVRAIPPDLLAKIFNDQNLGILFTMHSIALQIAMFDPNAFSPERALQAQQANLARIAGFKY